MIWKRTDAEFAEKTCRRKPLRSPRLRVSNPDAIQSRTSHEVATGCSHGCKPVERKRHHPQSPEGATGTPAQSPAAPSGLFLRCSIPNHGLTPMATSCRPFGTQPKETRNA